MKSCPAAFNGPEDWLYVAITVDQRAIPGIRCRGIKCSDSVENPTILTLKLFWQSELSSSLRREEKEKKKRIVDLPVIYQVAHN